MTMTSGGTTLRRRLIEWLFFSLALALAAASFSYLHQAEVARLETAEQERLRILTALLADNIEVDLAATNVALEGVIRDYLAPGAGPVSVGGLQRRLSALVGAMPGVRALLVIDRDGALNTSSLAELNVRNFAGRAYFQTARAAPSETVLYVSAPFHSIRGDLVITVARMVPDAGGRFNGLVVATLDPEYFTAKFRTAMYAPDVWALAVHGDGRQLLNYPSKGAIDGTNLDRPGTFFRRHRDGGQATSILSGTVYTTGEQRVMALHTIQPAALRMDRAIVIGLSREPAAIAVPLRRQGWTYALIVGALASCGAGLLFWSQRRRIHLAGLRAQQEQQRHALQVVSDSEARFRTLIEDAPLAIAILRRGRFLYSNPRYRALHGYAAADDLAGLPWRAMIDAGSLAALGAHEAMLVADSPNEQMFETLGRGKQGRTIPIFKTTARVLLADGPATLVFAQDISAQKKAEAEMVLARDAAEAASRSKAAFLANMSHEIRSPLNAILGMAYLLERGRLDADGVAMTGKIRAAGQSLLGILNDVLDMSKIEAGHMAIEQAPFRLAEVIARVAAGMGIAAAGKPLELLVGAPPAGVDSVLGDALRLEQVLVNLTGNAIKFTPGGRVELRTELAARDGEAMVLRFCVRDSGIGIAPEMQGAIFSAFTQADNSTTRHFGGSGLGLTICRQLVRLMGGELSLTSAVGQGSEFCFTVPLRDAAASRHGGAAAALPAPLPALTGTALAGVQVLVVDDSEINRDVVQRILREHGAVTVFASNGRQALDWLIANPDQADIVLMDVQMPVMDGIEATRALRLLPQFQDLPVIALTAGAFTSQQETALAAGMTHFISKPFDVAATVALIARLHRREAILVATAAAPPPGDADLALDLPQGLGYWGDAAPYHHYLKEFSASYGDMAERIRSRLAAGAPDEALALAHKLAGVAGNLAQPATRHAVRTLEALLRSGAPADAALTRLKYELERAGQAIAREVTAMPAPALREEEEAAPARSQIK